MNANDVIESYVNDVAVQLPRKQRNDVAFELRALIDEELQARADAGGRAVDAAMATEWLQAFGRPDDVAARYRPTLTIIDPADGHAFVRATFIGLAIIWSLGLLQQLGRPIDSGWDLLLVLGPWWTGSVIPSLWWPGLLVVAYGSAAWARRRRPPTTAWVPRSRERITGGRSALVMGLLGMLCGIAVLLDPRWLLDLFLTPGAAPAAYDALTYSESFRQRQAPWLLGLLLLNLLLVVTIVAMGRRTTWIRRMETGLGLVMCAALAWTIGDGPVLITPAGDQMAKACLALIVLYMLIHYGLSVWHRVRPAPGTTAR